VGKIKYEADHRSKTSRNMGQRMQCIQNTMQISRTIKTRVRMSWASAVLIRSPYSESGVQMSSESYWGRPCPKYVIHFLRISVQFPQRYKRKCWKCRCRRMRRKSPESGSRSGWLPYLIISSLRRYLAVRKVRCRLLLNCDLQRINRHTTRQTKTNWPTYWPKLSSWN